MCQELHCLPQAGGWLDQDSFIVYGMDLTLAELKAKEATEEHQRQLKQGRGRR